MQLDVILELMQFMALIAAGVKRSDEVITTPFTYMATVEAIMFIEQSQF